MRLLFIVPLILLCFSTSAGQLKEIVQDKGNFGLHVVDDRIANHKYLERENQLLLIGYRHVQTIDLTNFKVIETRPIDLPSNRDLLPGHSKQDWTISPDGRHMVLIGLEEARTKTKTENKLAAFVVDLQTGKRIARLDRPDRILKATWSKNGKTLVTMDAGGASFLIRSLNVSFWDGETFEYRHGIPLENATWTYLSNDGERFFAASGKGKNLFGIKYVADADSVVRIWKTGSGELEKTIDVGDARFNPKTREIGITPDEQFLLMVNKHKSNSSEHRLLAWEINGGVNPKYELQPRPKIDDSRLAFSPDGKYFALDVGKNLQIYETETGKLRVELANVELPSWGWMDNDTFASIDYKQKNFFEQGLQLKAFDANDGRLLFKQKLEYEEGTSPRSFDEDETIVTDTTTLRPHPTKKIFLTFSNQFAKIFDSRTGELLQVVVEPLIKIDLMGKPRKAHGHTVLSADWTREGKTLYVFSANRQSVSLWKLIE